MNGDHPRSSPVSDASASHSTSYEPVKNSEIEAYSDAELIEFHKVQSVEDGSGVRTWYGRGQDFVVAYSEVAEGAVLERFEQPDEYMVILPDGGLSVSIESAAGAEAALERQLAIVPPGPSRIVAQSGEGRVVRLFGPGASDLFALAINAATYEHRHPNIAPFKPWPAPKGGFRLRVYPMAVPAEEGRFGVLYRSTNLMVNVSRPTDDVGDPDYVFQPHHHDDFEQCSLTLAGDYVHHIRWPWTTKRSIWREDRHIVCSAPSMTLIPPPAIHTSKPLPEPPCHLIDIWGPPRRDFSSQPGWVLNAEDYPLPEE